MLRDPTARRCLTGVVVSGFGSTAMWLASGIWVKDLTGSDALAALTVFALWAATPFGPALGTLADRGRRRTLLVRLNLALAALLLTLCAVDSAPRVWLLFAVLVVYGVGGVVAEAAEAALVAVAVDQELLGDFNGLRMAAGEGVKLIAPLAGAALYVRFGGVAVAVLDALTFLAAAAVFASRRISEPAPVTEPEPVAALSDGARPGLRARTAEGVRALWGTPALRPLVLAAGAAMVCSGLGGAFLYAVVDRGLGRSPAFLGVYYAVQGAGSVVAGLLAGPLMRRLPVRAYAAAGCAVLGVALGLRALPYDAAVLGGALAAGLGLPAVLIAALTTVQREVPPGLTGRVAAGTTALVYAPAAVAMGVGPALVAAVDHRLALPVVAAAAVGTAVVLARSGRSVREPAGTAVRPGTAGRRSGS
ncbi:MFS transporter [Streptomyces antimicrobicus]|uniref:MFS transporter n=1 Tax=Streptomyces antimicrobicus TaxID=2883108 RepID=A0ABS8B8R5_9ACTN|nr:MFS transporter [Streptomyces antimicrobicus]MCB5181010.1 MFS transporter [Streptomyces antimicrobicus]